MKFEHKLLTSYESPMITETICDACCSLCAQSIVNEGFNTVQAQMQEVEEIDMSEDSFNHSWEVSTEE